VSGRAPQQQQPQPQAESQGPIPPEMRPVVFAGFSTMNSLAARPSIEDDQCSWMDGFMPVGKSTARTMPGISPAIFTSPDYPIVFFDFASVANVPYCIAVTLIGDIWAISPIAPFTARKIAAAAIASPSQLGIGVSQWGNQFVIIVCSGQPSGNGLFFWDGTTFYNPGDTLPGYTTVATGIEGSSVETFQGRAWICNGATVYFSAPQDPGDFSTGDGGGAFTSFDAFLRVSYVRAKQSSGFLYLLADSSVNYISQITVAGSPPTTSFSNQNADPEIGTPFPNTVVVWSRTILSANAFGVHQMSGGAMSKVSDIIDGTYDSTGINFNANVLSACKAIIYGRRVYMLLIPVVNPTTGQTQNKLACWDGKRWWFATQEIALTLVGTFEINSIISAYGTNASAIYPLFQTPSTAIQKVIQSKLFPGEGGPLLQKSANRIWGSVIYNNPAAPLVTLTIDNETGGAQQFLVLSPNPVTWVNTGSTDDDIIWVNSDIPGDVSWNGQSQGITVFPPAAIAQNGTMLGLTFYTNCADLTLLEMVMGLVVTQYRG
jgi:hypothetical protein